MVRAERRPRRWPARVLAAAGPPPDPLGACRIWARLFRLVATSGWSGPRTPHRWPAPVRAAAGPPPAPPGPAGSGPGCSGRWRRRGGRAVGRLVDGQRPFVQRPGLRRLPQVPQDRGPGCSGRWRRRGGPGRRPPHRWPAPVLAAAGPPAGCPRSCRIWPGCSGGWRRRGGPGRRRPRRWPAPVRAAAGPPGRSPGPAGSGPGCSGRWRRRGGPGRRPPRSMASARSGSGRASAGCPRSCRIRARLFRPVATSGWSGP